MTENKDTILSYADIIGKAKSQLLHVVDYEPDSVFAIRYADRVIAALDCIRSEMGNRIPETEKKHLSFSGFDLCGYVPDRAELDALSDIENCMQNGFDWPSPGSDVEETNRIVCRNGSLVSVGSSDKDFVRTDTPMKERVSNDLNSYFDGGDVAGFVFSEVNEAENNLAELPVRSTEQFVMRVKMLARCLDYYDDSREAAQKVLVSMRNTAEKSGDEQIARNTNKVLDSIKKDFSKGGRFHSESFSDFIRNYSGPADPMKRLIASFNPKVDYTYSDGFYEVGMLSEEEFNLLHKGPSFKELLRTSETGYADLLVSVTGEAKAVLYEEGKTGGTDGNSYEVILPKALFDKCMDATKIWNAARTSPVQPQEQRLAVPCVHRLDFSAGGTSSNERSVE